MQGGELDDVKASPRDLIAFLLVGFVLIYALLVVQFGRLILPLVILAKTGWRVGRRRWQQRSWPVGGDCCPF